MSHPHRSISAMASAALLLAASYLPMAAAFAQANSVPGGLTITAVLQSDPANTSSSISYRIGKDIRDQSGNVIVPAGSTGSGRMIQYAKSPGFGNPGKTEVSLDEILTPDGKSMSVKARATNYGKDGRLGSYLLAPVVLPLPALWSWLNKGGSGKIGKGSVLVFHTES